MLVKVQRRIVGPGQRVDMEKVVDWNFLPGLDDFVEVAGMWATPEAVIHYCNNPSGQLRPLVILKPFLCGDEQSFETEVGAMLAEGFTKAQGNRKGEA